MPLLITADKAIYKVAHEMNLSHTHNLFYEFYFLISGERFFSIGEYTYNIKPNTIMVVPRNVHHRTGGGPYVRYSLNVFAQALTEEEQTLIEKWFSSPIVIAEMQMKQITDCLDNMQQIEGDLDYEKNSKVILSYVLFLIDNFINANDHTNKNTVKQQLPLFLSKILDYIDKNINNDLSLNTISNYILYSPTYIRRQFKLYMGQTLNDYILNKRLDLAKMYLRETHKPLSEIAQLCGYSSANYLTLIFTKKEKLSPTAYRKIPVHGI